MRVADFIGRFAEKRQGSYVDADQFDCGISEDVVCVRDKASGTVYEFQRQALEVSSRTRMSPLYYLFSPNLVVLMILFVFFFMMKAFEFQRTLLEACIIMAVFSGIVLSPFVARLLICGFRVIILYFAFCLAFSVIVGSWERYVPVEGLAAFYAIGVVPYVGSRVFRGVWGEALLVLRSPGLRLDLSCPLMKANALLTALGASGKTGRK